MSIKTSNKILTVKFALDFSLFYSFIVLAISLVTLPTKDLFREILIILIILIATLQVIEIMQWPKCSYSKSEHLVNIDY